MSWFSNLRMRNKLLAAFGTLLAMMVFVAVLAERKLTDLQEVANEINTSWLPSMKAIGDMRTVLREHRMQQMGLFLATDSADVARHEAALKEAEEKMPKLFAAYEAGLISNDEDRGHLNEVRASWAAYVPAARNAITLFLNDKKEDKKEGQKQEEKSQEADELRKARALINERYDEVVKQAVAHIEFNVRGADRRAQDAERTYRSARVTIFASLAVAVLAGIALTFFISRRITEPLIKMIGAMKRGADGDLTARIEVSGKDEVGEAGAVMNTFLVSLHETMSQVAMTSSQVASASEQLSASSEQLASGTQQQAAAVEETAASLEQMTGAVKQNAENANAASALASGSKSGGDAASATSAMAEISRASKKIGEIIGVIDEIAFQTNLLALNAAVEAARAGDQGRGFAVVAAEVRILAQRSATAAKEIKVLINDSLHKVEDGSALVKRVTDFMVQIASANGEQASGIDQLNKAIAQMDQVVQSNSSQTEELSATASELNTQAEQLRAMVDRFQLDSRRDRAPEAAQAAPEMAPLKAASPQRLTMPKPDLRRGRATRARRAELPAMSSEPPPRNGHSLKNGQKNGHMFDDF